MVLRWQKIEKENEEKNEDEEENEKEKKEENEKEDEEENENEKDENETETKEKEKEPNVEQVYPLEWLLKRVTGIELYPVLRAEDPLWKGRQLLVQNTFKSMEIIPPGSPFQQIFFSIAFRLCGRPSFFIEHFNCRLPFPHTREDLESLEKKMRDTLATQEKVFTGRYQHPSVDDYMWVLTWFLERKSNPWNDTWEHFDTFSIQEIFVALTDLKFIDHFFAWQVC